MDKTGKYNEYSEEVQKVLLLKEQEFVKQALCSFIEI